MAKDKDDKNKKAGVVRRTSIGGQAVLEGVMMKGERSIATAVRTESGEITIESKRVRSPKERNAFLRLPFIRGVVNLCSQLFMGTGILLRSAEVYGDFAEPGRFEKWIAAKLKINPMNILMGVSVVLGLLLAVGLFIFLPNFIAGLIFDVPALRGANPVFYSLVEGGFMLLIFVLYVLSVSLMKDIRRVFMYHGAEHKVISCYEHGLELTVENAKTMRTEHSRCGTTFMFFVVAVSILVFALINWMLDEVGWLTDSGALNALIKLGMKLLFIPVVAGISYELLKLLAKSDNVVFRILRAPGMWLQKLTTRQPTDEMLEVSLTAFKTVMAMDADPTLPETKFDVKLPYAVARKRIEEIARGADASDIDWLMVEVTGKKRSELGDIGHLTREQYESAEKIAQRISGGEPLQYALGNTEFYGIRLAVNPAVLIPRPETEELAERAVNEIKERCAASEGTVTALDMCTGSGAVAIALAKNAGASVTAADISAAALDVARANALTAGAAISFKAGDLFDAVGDERFDLIVCNPPYIPSADIALLESKVKDFEPVSALDGGPDGLDFVRRIASEAASRLNPGGVLFMEFGAGQSEKVRELFSAYRVAIFKDMEGSDRILRAEV